MSSVKGRGNVIGPVCVHLSVCDLEPKLLGLWICKLALTFISWTGSKAKNRKIPIFSLVS